jgi:hypothetical protein
MWSLVVIEAQIPAGRGAGRRDAELPSVSMLIAISAVLSTLVK